MAVNTRGKREAAMLELGRGVTLGSSINAADRASLAGMYSGFFSGSSPPGTGGGGSGSRLFIGIGIGLCLTITLLLL